MTGKARVNLTVSEPLPSEARAAGLDLSRTLEEALEERLREARWREQNAEAVRSYNAHVAEHGVFGSRFRRF